MATLSSDSKLGIDCTLNEQKIQLFYRALKSYLRNKEKISLFYRHKHRSIKLAAGSWVLSNTV